MGAEALAVGPRSVWGTWEELVLGGAILRHGTQDWNVVVSELRARTVYPYTFFTPEACKTKYEDLQKRFAGSTAWFEELRKQRVAELKRELARSDDSIGSLESKIKSLEAQKQNSNQGDVSSQTESPLPLLNSDGTESLAIETSKDEHAAGSFTEDIRTRKNSLSERYYQAVETDTSPDTSVSSKQDKDLSIKNLPASVCRQIVMIRKRRGERKRKTCNQAFKEGSLGESDNLRRSSNVASMVDKDRMNNSCVQRISDSRAIIGSRNLCVLRRDYLMDIFKFVEHTEPAAVFRHRMDSQKRTRYRKVIRHHLDIDTIRSRIIGQSIKSAKELFRDLLLLANNALVFYSRRTPEYKSALSLRQSVMKEYKQHCRGTCREATSSFIPCNPPVRQRSARTRPRPHPELYKEKASEKLCSAENVKTATPEAFTKPCDLGDYNTSLHHSIKARKGLKRAPKGKLELADTRAKILR